MAFRVNISHQDPFELALECIKLVNHELDLRDFFKLINNIEQVNRSKLTQWKNEFTTNFLKRLKSMAKSQLKSVREKYLEIVGLSTFHAFIELYDQWVALTKAGLLNGAVAVVLFEFVTDTRFIIVAPMDDVKSELESIMKDKWRTSKLNFARGALDLVNTGVQYQDMIDYIADTYRIDPNTSVRRAPTTAAQLLEEVPSKRKQHATTTATATKPPARLSIHFLKELSELSSYNDGWLQEITGEPDSEPGNKIPDSVIESISNLVIALNHTSEPTLGPMSDGSVVLRWPGSKVYCQVCPDDKLVYANQTTKTGREWNINSSSSFSEAVQFISSAIATVGVIAM